MTTKQQKTWQSAMKLEWPFSPGKRRARNVQDRESDSENSSMSYGRLAVRLERDLGKQDGGRSVLIVSAGDDAVGVEAMTELAWHLAESLGRSVLLVDGTFSQSALSKAFDIPGDAPGIMNLLDAPVIDVDVLRAAVLPTQHADIGLLCRGHGDNGRLIAARSGPIRQLLDAAAEAFDFVLVQGSLFDVSGRSMAFGAVVDAALLVAVEGASNVQDIQRGQHILNDSGAQRVGLVLASAPAARPGAA
jgi:Mrp family chromosome partitioning ATPase